MNQDLYQWIAIAISWGWIAWIKVKVDRANQYSEVVAAYIRLQRGKK